MLNFYFLDKGLVIVSPAHFVYDFSKKCSPFFCMTKKSRQKLKYLENENNFEGEIKSIFHHF